jgi:hypothetical protein
MEYQCFYLSENYKLAHEDDAEVLFESDSLGECCSFVYNLFRKEGKSIAVYQPRSKHYRELYRKSAWQTQQDAIAKDNKI